MSKYQEIGGEIYVEGGPKCDGGGHTFLSCEGTGKFIIYPGAPLDTTPDQSGEVKDCVYCNGTGTEALSKWGDKVKADWLAKNPPKNLDGCLGCSDDDLAILWNRVEKLWYVIYQSSEKGFATVTYDADYSTALTVAVIIVAKEQ